jgi:hypothetical protein
MRRTSVIAREDLVRDCLAELRLWPGCDTVESVGVLASGSGKFSVHVVEYGSAKKHIADRAIRFIQREKRRCFHLKTE